MKGIASYDFAAVFARLTCVFEDAAGVASKGQAAGWSTLHNRKLATELGAMHRQAGSILQELVDALDQ